MRVGEVLIERRQVKWHECQVCGVPAYWRITYLVEGNCRANPTSSAYGRNDCSWCSDAEAYACRKHEREVRQDAPRDMSWCATFPLKKYRNMGFYSEVLR